MGKPAVIEVLTCGPMVTIQDGGRPGHLSQGLARGGAADRRALKEATALLGDAGAGIETPGSPLRLRCDGAVTISLTGAPMKATVGDRVLAWNTSQHLTAGDILDLRPTGTGVYSYVHVAGGFLTEAVMGSRAAHLIANIGAPLQAGDVLPCNASTGGARRVEAHARWGGGELRLVRTPQTRLFPPAVLDRFLTTRFIRDVRGNRQGVKLSMAGAGFATDGQLNLLSDFILPGDVQMTGDGIPYILGPECQTTGGYPRIGTVIEADLPRAMQAVPGAVLTFRFVTPAEARAARPGKPAVTPLIRDPGDMPDLLAQQLIGGVVSATGEET
ncbi:biotin-dependent carboxyltransferase family protein [Jannaschia donghaensis]|uniref:KipI antagonist n=1 Tax=Jannaschia donghaensis TaxID=420998 RepID=A0A0M6YIU7_9RHOB|nr:biotin-dependent carboxyltransferase family protein [Jannaschia donghaensis]CTQ50278.1 KipI antagonist [Jannaschia donghaensis]